MDMMMGEQIGEANLAEWRKLAQGLHARYLVDDFGTGVRFPHRDPPAVRPGATDEFRGEAWSPRA